MCDDGYVEEEEKWKSGALGLFWCPGKAEREKGKARRKFRRCQKKETDMRKLGVARMGHFLISFMSCFEG